MRFSGTSTSARRAFFFFLVVCWINQCEPIVHIDAHNSAKHWRPGQQAWREGSSFHHRRDGGDSRRPGEDWAEEKRIASNLIEKVVRKVSMKRWIRERHAYWPSRPMTERLKVEEWHEQKLADAGEQGWQPPSIAAPYSTMRREKWTALAETSTKNGKGSGNAAKLSLEASTPLHVTSLRGGYSNKEEPWRRDDEADHPAVSICMLSPF
jgi:hypothetical protein